MSVTASPALITASCAAATNDRPAGNRRNSDVCDKNTRRGGGSLDMTPQHPSTRPTRGPKFAGGWPPVQVRRPPLPVLPGRQGRVRAHGGCKHNGVTPIKETDTYD